MNNIGCSILSIGMMYLYLNSGFGLCLAISIISVFFTIVNFNINVKKE